MGRSQHSSDMAQLLPLWALPVPKPGSPEPRPWRPKLSCPSLPGALPQPQHSQVDFVVETRDALVCPVFPQLGQNVAQSVRPRSQRRGHSKAASCGPHVPCTGPSSQPQVVHRGACLPGPCPSAQREAHFQALPLPHQPGLTW